MSYEDTYAGVGGALHEEVRPALDRAADALEVLALLRASRDDADPERRERHRKLAVQKADVIAGRG